jgi:hypothetical protein
MTSPVATLSEQPMELLGLGIGPKAPVAEHLEERGVASVTNLIKVLRSKTGLEINKAVSGGMGFA